MTRTISPNSRNWILRAALLLLLALVAGVLGWCRWVYVQIETYAGQDQAAPSDAIGVFGAVSVATACLIPGSVAYELAESAAIDSRVLNIEHPSGYFSVSLDVRVSENGVEVTRAALLRTARLLMRGDVFVPSAVWPDA